MNQAESWAPLAGLYQWEREQPDAIYLTQPDGATATDYSWAQVGDQVRRMAAHLKSLNFPAGSRIAILGKNSAHWIMADLAIWMAGHVSVPIYPSLAADNLRYILEHSGAERLFLGRLDDWPEMQAGVPARLPIITLPGAPEVRQRENVLPWEDLVKLSEPMQGETRRDAGELATLIYTSGTTGLSKGVMLSFGAFAVVSRLFDQVGTLGPADRMLSYLPLAHAFERVAVETPSLRYGFRIYFNDSLATFPADLKRARPTVFHSVPRLWVKFQLGVLSRIPQEKLSALLANPASAAATRKQILEQLGLDQARAALTGSAPLPPAVLQWYRDLGLELLEGYGMSEDFAYSHLSLPGRTRVGYVGEPLPGVERRIADTGEIQVNSPARLMGYYKEPSMTASAFTEDGYFKTGDMGEIDEEGRLKITGRVKELFKTSKGKYVSPAPIENKLLNHPKVEVVCVTGAGQPQPVGLVMLTADAQKAMEQAEARSALEGELQDLLERVNATLDPHEQLDFVVVVKEQWTITNGYLTPTMKIKRNVIEKRYEPQIEPWAKAKCAVIWEA